MTALGPIPVTVLRYACPHCSRSRSKRQATAEHIARCWQNPEVRSCKSCVHFEPAQSYGDCEPGRPCDCGNEPAFCAAGVDLPDRDQMPVTNCPQWEAKP